MSKLRSLLIAVGTIAVAGVSVVLFVPEPGVTRAELLDAGLDECTPVLLRCAPQLTEEGQAELADSGMANLGAYPALDLRGWVCDGGVVLPPLPPRLVRHLRFFADDGCEVVDGGCGDGQVCSGARLFRVAQHRCACSTGADCFVGGQDAGTGYTLPAGSWAGAGCRRKVCVEVSGVSSWPSECPE